jgi:hypothetical protein
MKMGMVCWLLPSDSLKKHKKILAQPSLVINSGWANFGEVLLLA